MVIEPIGLILKVKENPVGGMTNSPDLNWHLKNLNNYVNLSPNQVKAKQKGNQAIHPFGHGGDSVGLPGDFTPPARFVRTVFFKATIDEAQNEEQAVTNCWHVLNSVRIPKGVVIQENNAVDYTQYVAAMCSESKTYYFSNYENNRIQKVQLTSTLLETMTESKVFKVDSVQDMYTFFERLTC